MIRSYDAVVHLVTAADGAPFAYTLANNAARTESAKGGWVGGLEGWARRVDCGRCCCINVSSHYSLTHYHLPPPHIRADARVLDRRIKAAWAAHPQQLVIDNATDFAGKLARTDQAILAAARAFFGDATPPPGVGQGQGPDGQGRGEGAVGRVAAPQNGGGNGNGGGSRQQAVQGQGRGGAVASPGRV